MSSQLSQEDKMLLGEIDLKGNAIKNGSADDHTHDSSKSDGAGPSGLIAMAGNLVPVDRVGNKVNDAQDGPIEGTKTHGKTNAKKRGASATAESSGENTPIATELSISKKAKTEIHCGADIKEPKTPSPKKRASPRKKAAGDPIKAEADNDEPITPSPKKRSPTKKAVKGNTDKSVSPTKEGDSTVRNTPRQRAAPAKSMAAPRGIPTSWETADDADKMLVMMKEQGEDWAAIREAWKDATGQDTANSTLPNRYARIKVNMMHLKEGDAIHLITAKKEAEAEMWAHVATKMEAKGADKYATTFLQKQFKVFEDQAVAAGLTVDAYVDTIAATDDIEEEENEEEEGGHAIDAFVKEGEGDVTGSE